MDRRRRQIRPMDGDYLPCLPTGRRTEQTPRPSAHGFKNETVREKMGTSMFLNFTACKRHDKEPTCHGNRE